MLLSFLLVVLIVELTPGPNMAYLALLSASEGRRAGAAATLGIATGLLGIGCAAAFGLAGVMTAIPALYDALRWAGIGYMLWLAYESWRDEPETSPGRSGDDDGAYFRRGLITNLLNPKAAVFFIALLPRFVDPIRPVLAQTLTLTAVYVLVATVIHATIVLLAGFAAPALARTAHARAIRRTFALTLVAIAFWFAWGTVRPR